jgi:hypothetical protein
VRTTLSTKIRRVAKYRDVNAEGGGIYAKCVQIKLQHGPYCTVRISPHIRLLRQWTSDIRLLLELPRASHSIRSQAKPSQGFTELILRKQRRQYVEIEPSVLLLTAALSWTILTQSSESCINPPGTRMPR